MLMPKGSVIEHLPSMVKGLSLILSTAKKKVVMYIDAH
jgi:hypothetical protein